MKPVKRCYELLSQLSTSGVYSWGDLKEYSKSPGRDVRRLLDERLLNKVGPGLYLIPKKSRFGAVPATEQQLVSAFLKTHNFLMFSTNLYNSLGLGLTQLKNETVVYNNKRHEMVRLSGRSFSFKRPNNGFPKKLTKEFLLVDLMNHLNLVGESPTELRARVTQKVLSEGFDKKLLLRLANQYGKVGTRKFFNQLKLDKNDPHKKAV